MHNRLTTLLIVIRFIVLISVLLNTQVRVQLIKLVKGEVNQISIGCWGLFVFNILSLHFASILKHCLNLRK